MKKYVVYKITNIKNKRVYIGSTSDFEIRKSEHLGHLRNGTHCNRFLQLHFNEFGEENFVFDIIYDDFNTRESMLLREHELILKAGNNCYNIDKQCPVVSGRKKRSKSVRGGIKMLYGKNKPETKTKKHNYKLKIQHPKLDEIAERKKQRELNKFKPI